MTHTQNNRKTTSIAFKLVLTIIPLITVGIIILMTANYIITKKALIKSAEQTLKEATDSGVNAVETFVESTLVSLDRVYDTMRTASFSSEENKMAYLATTLEIQPEIPMGVYIGDNQNHWTDPSGWQPDENYQVAEQGWYKEGLAHETFAFGQPYIANSTFTYVVSATALLSSENGVDTVIAADVQLAALSEDIANIRFLEDGYCFLIDRDSLAILAHKDSSLIGTILTELSADPLMDKVNQMLSLSAEYTTDTVSNGKETYMLAMEPIQNTSWAVVSCIREATVLSSLTKLAWFSFFLSIVMIVLTALMLRFVIYKMIAPVKSLTSIISDITDGDLTVQIHTTGNDEISVMSAALEEFVEIMREVIGDIRDISDQLSEQSDTSKAVSKTLHETATAQTDSSGDMQITMEQITNSVCDLAENAAYLLEVINDTAAIGERAEAVFLDISATVPEELSVQLGELGAAFDEMLTKIHSVTDVAVSLADLSEEQSASAEEVLASTTLLAEASLRLAKEGTRVSECADIVSASAFTLAEHMRKFKL